MKDIFIRWFTTLNAFLIRITGGRIGSKLGRQTILLLHTTGRRSGEPRVIPIAYFHYERNYLLVGSNWGKAKHADWYLNLLKEPHGMIQVDGKRISVNGHNAQGDEYVHLWKFVTERHAQYLDYQKMTERQIPIMVLQPTKI